MDVKEQKISFKVARLANLKGFDPNIKLTKNSHYNSNTEVLDSLGVSGSVVVNHYYAANQALLQKWLRDIHNIDVLICRDAEIHYKNEIRYIATVSNFNNIKIIETPIANIESPEHYHFIDNKSYEQALEIGLEKALNLI